MDSGPKLSPWKEPNCCLYWHGEPHPPEPLDSSSRSPWSLTQTHKPPVTHGNQGGPAPGRSVDRGAPSHTRFVLSPTAGRLTDYYNHSNNSSTYPPDTVALLTWLVPLIHRSELLEVPLFCSQENHSLGGVSDIPKVTQDLSCKAHSSYPLRHSLLPWRGVPGQEPPVTSHTSAQRSHTCTASHGKDRTAIPRAKRSLTVRLSSP